MCLSWEKCIIPWLPFNPIFCIAALLLTYYIDGLVQEKRNSIANALKLRLFLHQPIDIML